MKKVIALLLTLAMCLSLCACGTSAAVTEFVNAVDAIGTVTLDSEDAITAAENAYNALSDKEKENVSENTTVLESKRKQYDALVAELNQKLDSVISLIETIGDVTLDSEPAIIAAEEAYGLLSDDEKAMITESAKTLSDARTAYETAKTAYEAALAEERAAHAAEVTTAIDAIGSVTLDSKDAIAEARKLYDALTPEEKELVANLSILETAEADFAVIWETEKQKIIDEYSKKFEIDSDPIEGISWYMHYNMPDYIDTRCYIIPYIGVRGNNAWICIRYNYTGDSWIFWENLTIMADGVKYYKYVGYYDTVRDNDSDVWEWWDEPLNYNQAMDSEQLQMLAAIANSEETIIRFEGDEYYYDLYVTDADKAMIRDVLALYEALIG